MTWQATYARRHRAVSIERPPAPPRPMTDAEFEAWAAEVEETNPLGAVWLRVARDFGRSRSHTAATLLAASKA